MRSWPARALLAGLIALCGAQDVHANDEKIGGEAGVVTVLMPAMLGNMLFRYATLQGIAATSGLTPVVSVAESYTVRFGKDSRSEDRLRKFAKTFRFDLPEEGPTSEWTQVLGNNIGWGRFDPSLLHVKGKAVRVEFSPLVPGYFHHLGRAHIRDEIFRFPDDVRAEARDFLNLVRAETGGTRKIVGIHVRRDWDTLRQEGMEIEWSRNVEYFSRAIEVTRKLFGPIAIVICTDDYAWASMAFKSLPQEEFPVFFSPHANPDPELTRKCKWTMACNAPLVDMAILASSDAVVVSGVSTFSWWAAYLVQEEGVVVAPRQPINPQGTFGPCDFEENFPHARCKDYWSEEYNLPDWILLDENPGMDLLPEWWGPHVAIRHEPHRYSPEGDMIWAWDGTMRFSPGASTLPVTASHLPIGASVCLFVNESLHSEVAVQGDGGFEKIELPVSGLSEDTHRAWLCPAYPDEDAEAGAESGPAGALCPESMGERGAGWQRSCEAEGSFAKVAFWGDLGECEEGTCKVMQYGGGGAAA